MLKNVERLDPRMLMGSNEPDIAGMSPQQIADAVAVMEKFGAPMRLDRFSRMIASVSPDMVPNMLTQNITANLLDSYYNWGDAWRKICTVGKSDYMDSQILERVSQLGMIDKMADSGEELNYLGLTDADEISYSVDGYGDLVVVDMRTKRSDRLGYFDNLGKALGKATASRLHESIFVDFLQSNPTVDDDNSLFDETEHANDMDDSAAGIPFNYDNLVAAFRLLDAAVDGADEPLEADRAYVVVGKHWRETADQIVENDDRYDTSNRGKNTIKKRVKEVIYSRKNEYDWYIVADPKEIPGLHVSFFEGVEDPRVEMEPKTSTWQFTHPGRQRWQVYHYYGLAWMYWQGVVRGSTNVLAT